MKCRIKIYIKYNLNRIFEVPKYEKPLDIYSHICIYVTFETVKHFDGTDYASIETKQEKENLQLIFVLGDSFVASMYVNGVRSIAMHC